MKSAPDPLTKVVGVGLIIVGLCHIAIGLYLLLGR